MKGWPSIVGLKGNSFGGEKMQGCNFWVQFTAFEEYLGVGIGRSTSDQALQVRPIKLGQNICHPRQNYLAELVMVRHDHNFVKIRIYFYSIFIV